MDTAPMQLSATPRKSTATLSKAEGVDLLKKLALSIEQAADIADLGRSSIYVAIATGNLKAKKSGKRTIILRSDLNDFLAGLPAATFNSTSKLIKKAAAPTEQPPAVEPIQPSNSFTKAAPKSSFRRTASAKGKKQ
jgi:hypothetical protein